MPGHSDYIVYVDESGDHGLSSIDPQYPVFVLAYCIFEKEVYSQQIVPAVQGLKFKHFGHDVVLLHEREIRKAMPPFEFLVNSERRQAFMADLNELIVSSPFTLIATCIQKELLAERYAYPSNPYHLALTYGLERLWHFLRQHGAHGSSTHVVFECRGKREDRELELEFRQVCDGRNYQEDRFPFKIVFADKRTNSAGLQLADMVARPIGRHVMNPEQPNRAFELLRPKFYGADMGLVDGRGLKCFP
jgi:hypothetical protein